MRKTVALAAFAAALAVPALAHAQAKSPHSFSGNVGITSDYIFRGISQTAGKPALQGGFDYSHASGIYLGTWASNISWVQDTAVAQSSSLEWDFYGGYKGTISGDLGFDIGILHYYYPLRNKAAGVFSPDTTEIYGGLSYKWFSIKYSHSTSALFGWAKTAGGKTTGSGYLDLGASFDLGNGWGISGHLGHQTIRGNGPASYSDWKLAVTKDLGVGTLGFAITDTNAQDNCTLAQSYCWAGYSAGKGAAVVSFSKSF